MRYASSCCMHVRMLAVIGCTTTTYVKEDMVMEWVVGRSEWGRYEHVHDPGHATRWRWVGKPEERAGISVPPSLPHQETEPRRRSRLCSFSYVWYDTCDISFR